MARSTDGGERHGVALTHLDQPLFNGAGVTKGELVDYLDGVADRLVPALRDRPLSVIRTTGDQKPFMQKNVPKYTPDFVPTVRVWAEASKREVSYALCNDRRTLLWFANQRAVEYHPTLALVAHLDRPTHLVLDLDPPDGAGFAAAVAAAHLVRRALADVGLAGAVKSSGAKGVHVLVPLAEGTSADEAAAATRAITRRAELLDPDVATTGSSRPTAVARCLERPRSGSVVVVAAVVPAAAALARSEDTPRRAAGERHATWVSDASVRSASWSAELPGSSAMTPVIGSPCWTVTTVNMSGIVHRSGRRRGSTTRSHASSASARRWPVRCAIAPSFPPTSSSFEPRRPGTNTPCRPHCAEPTGWRAERGVGCESIGAVCVSWPRRSR